MSPGRAPYGAASHAPGRARARAAWVELLQEGVALGTAAASGHELGRLDVLAFAGLAVRAGGAPFPLPYVSAKSAADGFRAIARGFVEAVQPELRIALGGAMAAAARCCLRMIQIDTDEQAAAWRRRHGED